MSYFVQDLFLSLGSSFGFHMYFIKDVVICLSFLKYCLRGLNSPIVMISGERMNVTNLKWLK